MQDIEPPSASSIIPTFSCQHLRAVDGVFQALCEGALANPDLDAEEDEGDFFFDEVRLCSTGCPALTLKHLPTWGASDSQLS